MDTLDGMPCPPVHSRMTGRMKPARVEPLTALQTEFDSINSALINEPSEGGIRLAQAHLVSFERNLNAALSMYPIERSNEGGVPYLRAENGYIDPIIAELFRLRCREVLAKTYNPEADGETRSRLMSLQQKVQEATISVLDAIGIMDEMRDYRETLQLAIEGGFDEDLEKLSKIVNGARCFMGRINECDILPMDFKINAGLLAVQLAQLEDKTGLLF